MRNHACTQPELESRVLAELARRNAREDINQMMQLQFVQCSADEGSVELLHPMQDWEINIYGTMHGGLIALILDATMAVTCRSWTGDRATPTLDIHVNFLRPVKQGEPVHTKAYVVHAGRSVVQLRAELWTSDPAKTCASADAVFFRSDSAPAAK